MENVPYSNPEVLKYIRGEISFDTWLQNHQEGHGYQSQQHQPAITGSAKPTSSLSHANEAGSVSIFSSWGSAFTHHGESGGGSSSQGTSSHTMEEAAVTTEEEESDYDEEVDDSDEEISIMKRKWIKKQASDHVEADTNQLFITKAYCWSKFQANITCREF